MAMTERRYQQTSVSLYVQQFMVQNFLCTFSWRSYQWSWDKFGHSYKACRYGFSVTRPNNFGRDTAKQSIVYALFLFAGISSENNEVNRENLLNRMVSNRSKRFSSQVKWYFYWIVNITLTSQWARRRLKSPSSPLFTQLFIQVQIKKTSKLRVTGLCAENSPGTGEFPAQKASNEENVSIWWRHHGNFQMDANRNEYLRNADGMIHKLEFRITHYITEVRDFLHKQIKSDN